MAYQPKDGSCNSLSDLDKKSYHDDGVKDVDTTANFSNSVVSPGYAVATWGLVTVLLVLGLVGGAGAVHYRSTLAWLVNTLVNTRWV